jgi:hypothetical protein
MLKFPAVLSYVYGIAFTIIEQLRTIELCYTFLALQDCQLAIRSNAAQDSRTLLRVSKLFWATESCYTFQCSLGLSIFAARSNAAQDYRIFLDV